MQLFAVRLPSQKNKNKTKTSCYYISLLILLRNKFNGISKCDILSENHNKDKKRQKYGQHSNEIIRKVISS